MTPILASTIAELRRLLGGRVMDVAEFRGDVTVLVASEAIVEVATFLRDNPACPFPLLEDVFGVDAFTPALRFEVHYHLYSLREKQRLHLKLCVEESNPSVPTISGVFPAADWPERETYDMYGIVFAGHPDLRRIYMPEEFEHFPLRKDFPLMGIPGSIPLPER